jgi:rsbT co-antagonist protein RsbR
VLVMPIIGIIDEGRGESLLESMLSAVAGRSARYVILDLTGVESIDTAAAGLLLRVVRAGKLVGAHCVLTGVHPDMAMTLTRLGVDLGDLRTLRTVKDGLRYCLHELGAKSVSTTA